MSAFARFLVAKVVEIHIIIGCRDYHVDVDCHCSLFLPHVSDRELFLSHYHDQDGFYCSLSH